MHSSKTVSAGALLFIFNALSAYSFHVEYGTTCTTAGAACSYISNDSSVGGSATTTVSGFCAPDLHCASQGAKCDNDDSCFNYCGTDGTCGGEGAGCNTQEAFVPGQSGIACFGKGDWQCTATDGKVGQCVPSDQVKITAEPAAVDDGEDVDPANPAASQAFARRTKRRLSAESADAYNQHQVRSSDLRKAFARHNLFSKKQI